MSETKRLYRSRSDRMLAGVAGGMAQYFGIDSTIIRVIWVLVTIFTGGFGGLLAYVILALVVPEEPAGAPATPAAAAETPSEPPTE